METIDFSSVSNAVCSDQKKVLYEINKHNFTKIAFDVFQLNTSPIESYWILEKGEDGKEYLIAQYEDADPTLSVVSKWEVLSDKKNANVTLNYQGIPIARFASKDYGFEESNIGLFKKALVEKLSTDQSFVEKLLESLPEVKQSALKAQFPEFATK